MPHLVQMDKRYGKKGLQLIGVHRQGGPAEAVKKVVDKLKVEFPIAENGSEPISAPGIPHMFIFSTEGKLVFSGHPMDGADKVIKKELRKVSAETSESKGFGLPEVPKNLTEVREWTNSEGKTMKAALVSVDGNKAKLQLVKDNRIVDYLIEKLSEADQKLIASKISEDGAEEEE